MKAATPKARTVKVIGATAFKSNSYVPPTEHEIACCADAIYAQEYPQHARELWCQAKAQLIASRQHDAGLLKGTDMVDGDRWKQTL